MVGNELKAAIKAANITLDDLARETGIHASTLSRAQSGLILSVEQRARIATVLRAALKRAERNAARERAKLMPAKKAEQQPVA